MKIFFTLLFLLTAWGVTKAQTLSPAQGATDVTSTQEVSITFDNDIASGENFWTGIKCDPIGYLTGDQSISGNKLIIPHADFRCGLTYTITLEANTLKDQTEPITWSFTAKGPVPLIYTPGVGATGVSGKDEISVEFDMRLQVGDNFWNGISITPKPNPDVATKGKFDENNNYKLVIEGGTLAAGTTYTVEVDKGAISGLSETLIWSFTTKQATYDYVSPADGMTANLDAATFVQFTLNVEAGDNINAVTISPDPGNVSASVAQSSNRLVIAHDNYVAGTQYTVTVPAGAVKGIDTPISWKFTAQEVGIVSMIPEGGTKGVAINAEVKVVFNSTLADGGVTGITFNPAVTNVTGTVSGNTLNIAHDAFVYGTNYTVTIPANTISGITAPITWPFTTVGPRMWNWVPDNSDSGDENGVSVNAQVQVTYESSISQGEAFSDINITPNPGGVVPTISDNKLNIAHANFAAGTTYKITIPANAIKGITEAYSWSFFTVGPTASIYTPAVNTTGIAVDAPVSVDFNMDITAGDLSKISFSPPVTGVVPIVAGKKLSIAHDPFTLGTEYTVNIPKEAISGLAEAVSWKFTTKSPTVVKRIPDTDAENVDLKAAVTVEFDNTIAAGTAIGTIGFAPGVANVQAAVAGKVLTITHGDFAKGTEYTVTIPANAVKGQTAAISWKFKTEALSYSSRIPDADTKYVGVKDEVSVIFADNLPTTGNNLGGITITPAAGVSGVISGKKLTINHNDFAYGTDYTVTIPVGAISGLTSPITWSFSTIAPAVSAKAPVENTTVAINAPVSVTFAANIFKGVNFDNITIEPNPGITPAISGSKLTFENESFVAGKEYTVTIPADALKGLKDPVSWKFATQAPAVSSKTPNEGASGVAVDANISVVFASAIEQGAALSNITISPDAGTVTPTIGESAITIKHSTAFAKGADYTVTIPVGTIKGQTSEIKWTFTTIAPAVANNAYKPSLDAKGVLFDAEVSVEFEANIAKGAKFNDISISPSIAVTPSINAKKLTIGHAAAFSGATEYTVTIPVGAIKGQVEPITWKFTTTAVTPGIKTPRDGATGVAVNAGVAVEFDNNITLTNASGIAISPDPGNVKATANGKVLNIAHNNFKKGVTYSVNIGKNTVQGVTSDVSWSFTTIAPDVEAKTPTANSTGIALDAAVTVTFESEITQGADFNNITISPNPGSLKRNIAGNTLTIAHDDFDMNTVYTVKIPAYAINGQPEALEWKFTTAALIDKTLTPGDKTSGIALNTYVTVEFNMKPQLVDRSSITFSPYNGYISPYAEGNKLVIGQFNLDPGTEYTVTIPAGAIRGLTAPISWKFATVKPEFAKSTPDKGDTEVAVDQEVVIEFDYDFELAKGDKLPVFSPNVDGVYTSAAGNKLTVFHNDFASNTTYTITLPANTVKGQTEQIKWSFTTVMVSGIKDMDKLDAKLYPNPVLAGNEFAILTDDNSNAQRIVEIFNATGAIVLKTETSNSLIKLTAPKEQGVYLLRITSGKKAGVYRLVVH